MERFEHGGNIHHTKGQKVIDFSANINPCGLSPRVKEAIKDNIDLVAHYPDPAAKDLRESICRFYGVSDSNLVLGNGATELLYLLCHVLRPQAVVLPAPSFSEYERAACSAGAAIQYFPLLPEEDFRLSFDKLFAALPEESLLFLGNPNNPTGNLLLREEFGGFLQKAKEKNCRVVVDESFIDFLPDDGRYTCRGFVKDFDHIFIIHSMTKFFAIPGLRLGFGLFPPALAEKLKNAMDCWNVNSLAQAAGVAALSDKAYIAGSSEMTENLRLALLKGLEDIGGLKIYPSTVNFILLDISGWGINSAYLYDYLSSRGVLVRNCANYPGLDERYIRIAVRCKEENRKLLALLREVAKHG